MFDGGWAVRLVTPGRWARLEGPHSTSHNNRYVKYEGDAPAGRWNDVLGCVVRAHRANGAAPLTVYPPAGTLVAMSDAQRPRRWEESVEVLGRRFVLVVEGPVPPGRYDIRVWEGTRRGGRSDQYLRAPIRGRDADEARERALEVLHNYVGLDQFRTLVQEAAGELTPGAAIELSETAREVIVTLGGTYRLSLPLAIPREEVLGSDATPAGLRAVVRAHLSAYARRR